MSLLQRMKIIPTLVALLVLSFCTFAPKLALASTYGNSSYGICRFQEDCSEIATPQELNSTPVRDSIGGYEWLSYGGLILLVSIVIVVLVRRRRNNTKNKLKPTKV